MPQRVSPLLTTTFWKTVAPCCARAAAAASKAATRISPFMPARSCDGFSDLGDAFRVGDQLLGDREVELRALFRLRFDPAAPEMGLHEELRDGQAQAGAAFALSLHLLELLEQAADVV